jgi:hypothetical protein
MKVITEGGVCMRLRMWTSVLVAVLTLSPGSAPAQCGMTMEGGHQHDKGDGHEHDRKSTKGVDQKAKRNAVKLLDDPRGCDALMEAILEDPAFVRLLVARIMESPEGRAMLRAEWNQSEASDGEILKQEEGEAPPPDEAAVQPEYRCPMHPEVVSDRPGACPKCGMKLVETNDQP